jgi:putative peptidoglycan binding protein
MTAEPKPKLGPAGPAPSPVGEGPRPGEQFFKQSIADLSRRLGERKGAADPQVAAEERRRAMQAYERERMRKLRLVLTGAGAVFATAGLAWFVVVLGEPEAPASASQMASVLPPPSVTMALAEPVTTSTTRAVEPPPAAAPAVAPTVAESRPAAPAEPVQAAPPPPSPPSSTPAPQDVAAVPNDPPAAAPAPTPPPLSREGIREVQKRLAGFGFNPGPIDGVAGRKTEEAAQHYLETRGQSQMPPNDPQMLEQLRQDPAPQVAQPQVAQRPNGSRPAQASGANQPGRRSFDPFEPVKVAGTEITRFFQSVFR